MTIDFVDLAKQYRSIKYQVVEEISACIERGNFVGGYWVDRFQKDFAKFHNINHCIGVGSGTDALILALKALGIGPGDEVIVPANTFIATAFAVTHVGAKVVFVDADPKTYTIDCNDLERYLTKATKAIIPVHLYGNPADMYKIMSFADTFDLKVIEDCAQAIGAEYDEQRVGTFGDAAAFSFYPTKNLGGLAQGGAVVTNDEEVAEKIESLANVGRVKGSHYEYQYIGYNSRLDSVNALFLTKCLEEVSTWNTLRNSIAALYRTAIDRINVLDRQYLPEDVADAINVYHLFEVKCRNRKTRDSLRVFLDKNEISTALHYPVPCHKQIVYRDYNDQSFPVAEDLSDTLLSLPIHPWLTTEEATKVIEVMKEFFWRA